MRSDFTVELPSGTAFDLNLTLDCGQVLRWRRANGGWRGVVNGAVIGLRQTADGLHVGSTHDWVDVAFLSRYFRWGDNLEIINGRLAQDPVVRPLTARYRGLRLIRQEPWECLATYVCAIFKNIPAIQRMVDALARRFGDRISRGDGEAYAFPPASRLARASIETLRACGTGFRARYLKSLAQGVASGELQLDVLRSLTYEQARAHLLGAASAKGLLGLGPKVADCLLLFGLDKLEAFPIDVWVLRAVFNSFRSVVDRESHARLRRAVTEGSLTKALYERVSQRMRQHFRPYAGYAQQLLYHDLRARRRLSPRTPGPRDLGFRATPEAL
jgi:N-glycosylase/DNA lyase